MLAREVIGELVKRRETFPTLKEIFLLLSALMKPNVTCFKLDMFQANKLFLR